MKYYYAEKDQKFGPFTIEELKAHQLKKSTLVWCEGMQDWAAADHLDELKDILISEPPPLPKTIKANQTYETVLIKQASKSKTSEKYDLSYKKESEAVFVGIVLIVVNIILGLKGVITSDPVETYNQVPPIVAIISLFLKIVITVWVVNISTRQNRNSTGWGLLAFFFPSITLIVIGQLKKLRLKVELDENLSADEKATILLKKAHTLFENSRYSECLELLNKSIEIDKDNLRSIRLRGLTNYHLKKLDNSKKDFNTLVSSNSYLSESYYYLGNIEIQKYNRDEAIGFWKKALEKNNKKAQYKLDLFDSFTGEYLLPKSQIAKKLSSANSIHINESKYIEGIADIDNSENLNKLKTILYGHDNGLEIELKRMFKSYNLAIAFYEIKDIVYDDSEKKLELILKDQIRLQFKYNPSANTYNNGFKRFCSGFKEKTGRNPKALSYWVAN